MLTFDLNQQSLNECYGKRYDHIWCICIAGEEVAGKVSLKHVYEIALIKSKDPTFENVSLQNVCKSIITAAHSCGIEVVPRLEEDSYRQFLEERKDIVKQQEQQLEEIRQAKMLRL